MNDTIARLHAFDYTAAGLMDFGRPSNFITRQIALWSRQYLNDHDAGRIDAMDRLVEWLSSHVPQSEAASLIHGDFRVDNMIFHSTKPIVLAVLDWELSTLGNPLANFAYHLMMYHLPTELPGGMLGKDLQALQIPSVDQYVSRYCRTVGLPRIDDLNFYFVFSMFCFAAIVHGVKAACCAAMRRRPKRQDGRAA